MNNLIIKVSAVVVVFFAAIWGYYQSPKKVVEIVKLQKKEVSNRSMNLAPIIKSIEPQQPILDVKPTINPYDKYLTKEFELSEYEFSKIRAENLNNYLSNTISLSYEGAPVEFEEYSEENPQSNPYFIADEDIDNVSQERRLEALQGYLNNARPQ